MQEAELERIDSNFTRFNTVLCRFFLGFIRFLLKISLFLQWGWLAIKLGYGGGNLASKFLGD